MSKFLTVFLLLSMFSCERDPLVIVRAPDCKPRMIEICDSEVHQGEYATSSWHNNPLYRGLSFVNQTVVLPDAVSSFRLCRHYDVCDKTNFSDDYAVKADLPGFWLSDKAMSIVWSILETAFSREQIASAALAVQEWLGRRAGEHIHTMPINPNTEAEI